MRPRDFFYFNKSDRLVLLCCLVVGLIVCSLVFLVGEDGQSGFAEMGGDSARVARRSDGRHPWAGAPSGDYAGYYRQPSARAAGRFPFDPNTADSTTLLRLGLQPWQVRNIYRYRAAGGVYRRPLDFARLYGLTKRQYRELEPYIRIGAEYGPSAEFYEPRPRHVNIPDSIALHSPAKLKAGERVDLNTADTALLMRVPGIGRYFARRIDHYRQWIGGFYDPYQLTEIEYFPKEAISFFYVTGEPRKINVNKLPLNQLKRHPYLNYYQAKAIVDYRRQHGPLRDLRELRLVRDFSERDFERLSHYVEY